MDLMERMMDGNAGLAAHIERREIPEPYTIF